MASNKSLNHRIQIISSLVVMFIGVVFAPSAVAQQQDELAHTVFEIDLLQTPSVPRTFLIDIPGVGWKGEARVGNWGNMLDRDRITIYVRHQGPGWDKWGEPSEPDARIVTLPDQWGTEAADQLLLPVVKQAFSEGRDIQFVIDKNITLVRHLLPLPQSQEDRWAASVTDYITANSPSNFLGILAEHSRGTVTNDYIKDFSAFDYIIIASPRGDKSLEFIGRASDLPQIDIIRGLSDALSWRWTQSLSDLVKEHPNVRVIQLQDLGDPGTTHSLLQNLAYEGIWKVIDGGAGGDAQFLKGTLNDLLRPPSRQENPSLEVVQETGGIDFSSIELRFFTEYEDSLVGVGFRATPSLSAQGIDLQDSGDLSWDSLFTWLALPSDTFWVNLNPNEPNRIIDAGLGKTDAGRIMLEADFQMKKTIASLLHPDSESGQAFWDELYGYIEKQGLTSLCFSFRQWIVPSEVTVWATADSIYIMDATLDVKLESEYLELKGEKTSPAAVCPPDIGPALQAYAEDLFRDMILPELIKQVNTAPEYHDLRSIFHSRIIAEWYKSQHLASGQAAFSNLIGQGSACECYPTIDWDPKGLFDQYVQSVTQGEFNVTRQEQTRQGNYIVTSIRTYFYGGVDFTNIPATQITYNELLTQRPDVEQQIFDALLSPTGYWSETEAWLGGLYIAGLPETLAPAENEATSAPALTPIPLPPTTAPSAPTSAPSGSSGPCSTGAIPLTLVVWIGWRYGRRRRRV
ncbi:MAG: hypothetical protein ABIG43_05385 [Chloroflexota bacterium]